MVAAQAIQLYQKFKTMPKQREADVIQRFPDRMQTPSARRRFKFLYEQAIKQLTPQEQEVIMLSEVMSTFELSLYNEALLKLDGLIKSWVNPYLVISK